MFKYSFKINVFYKKRIKKKLVRPLLELKRFEILKLCRFWSLPVYIDSTNTLFNFRRNRVRYQILPILRGFFNPKLDDSLEKFIKISTISDYYKIQQFLPKNIFIIYNDKNKKSKGALKWVSYLPMSMYRKFYYHLFSIGFKYLTFQEITGLIKLNEICYK